MRTIKPHAETARAMLCLLGADPKAVCRDDFWGPARFGAIRFMQWTIGQRNFNLGALVSAEYVWTQSQNAYTTSSLNGRTADVYHVKFERQETTYYIARPDPDGKIHIWFGRNGAPDDEKTEPLGLSHIR